MTLVSPEDPWVFPARLASVPAAQRPRSFLLYATLSSARLRSISV